MDMVTVPKRVVDLLAQVQKYGAIARASELQEVYRLIVAHNAGAQEPVVTLPAIGANQCTITPPQPMTQEPDCWAILTPNGSRLVPSEEAKVRRDAYPLYTHPQPMTQTDAVRDEAKEYALLTLRRITHWPDGGNNYGQDKIKQYVANALAEIERIEGAKDQ